jgi:hypothetical protein
MTIDFGLFFRRNQKSDLIGHVDTTICVIYKMVEHKQDSCFYTDGLVYRGSL